MRQEENIARHDVRREETVCPTLSSSVVLVITVDLEDDYCYSCTPPSLPLTPAALSQLVFLFHCVILAFSPCL